MEIAQVPPAPIERFEALLGKERWQRYGATLTQARSALEGRHVRHVSSTLTGGGVAELLRPAISYLQGAGIAASWAAIAGDDDFFTVTKRLHHMLHGKKGDGAGLRGTDRRCYEDTLEAQASELVATLGQGDVVVLHDPQTLGLAPHLREAVTAVVWCCHIGADTVNAFTRDARRFLLPYTTACDAATFSLAAHVWEELEDTLVEVVPPCIDAFSVKNQELTVTQVTAILVASGIEPGAGAAADAVPAFAGCDGAEARVRRRCDLLQDDTVPADAPVVCQVSRWDVLKDHAGVGRMFTEGVAPSSGAHLVLAGPSPSGVADDPEGAATLEDLRCWWQELAPAVRRRVHVAAIPMDDVDENAAVVNALQRRSQVVVQKSLAEGFGLTVSEALFKRRPVVATGVGGIREQIANGAEGLLVDDPLDLAAVARAVSSLLSDPPAARELGERGRDAVVERFLMPAYLARYAHLGARLT